MNSGIWKNYWPVYKKLEKNVQELSYDIYFCDAHLKVFSINTTYLLMQIASECENCVKILNEDLNLQVKGRKNFFNYMHSLSAKYTKIYDAELEIIWSFQAFSQSKIKPFENLLQNRKPVWFVAYDKVKHDRNNNIKEGNLRNVIDSLAGLFTLNMLLRKDAIENENFPRMLFEERKKLFSDFFKPNFLIHHPKKGGNINCSLFVDL